jgi:YD repeat-containing protein
MTRISARHTVDACRVAALDSLFLEPVLPGRQPAWHERAELLDVIRGDRPPTAIFSALEMYVRRNPESPWAASILSNPGTRWFEQGRYSKALWAHKAAWKAAHSGAGRGRAPSAGAIGVEYARMLARLGRRAELKEVLRLLRQLRPAGRARLLLNSAEDALWAMENAPEHAFCCGPAALCQLWGATHPRTPVPDELLSLTSTSAGTSLIDLQRASSAVGLDLVAGRSDRLPASPSLIHWRVGHFAAVVADLGDSCLVADSTMGAPVRRQLQKDTILDEASGYYLARPDDAHLVAVPDAQAARVYGRGQTSTNDGDATSADDHQVGGDCARGVGAVSYGVHSLLVSLYVRDTPLTFMPARGPAMELQLAYSQRDISWPQDPRVTNFGPGWNCRWVAWLTERSGAPDSISAKRGLGGTEHYELSSSGGYTPERKSQAHAVRHAAGSYEITSRDGSTRFYNLPSAQTFPRRVYLTRETSADGAVTLYSYDAAFRLQQVRRPYSRAHYQEADRSTFQAFTLTYRSDDASNLPAFYEVKAVKDPARRAARFSYDRKGRLTKITDAAGNASALSYDRSGNLTGLATPRGRTTFESWETSPFSGSSRQRDLIARDPGGRVERVQFNERSDIGVPFSEPIDQLPAMRLRNSVLYARNSFFWSKHAAAQSLNVARNVPLSAADYALARVYHWLHFNGYSAAGAELESLVVPGNHRVWYAYEGQGIDAFETLAAFVPHENATLTGSSSQPIQVGTRLADGTDQIYRATYNNHGRLLRLRRPRIRPMLRAAPASSCRPARAVRRAGRPSRRARPRCASSCGDRCR